MADFISLLYQFGTNAAFLLLSALGLVVILGMMNIINLAHGEFMMLGAYAATASVQRGVPFPLAVLVAAVAVGIFGVVLERLVVRHFYGRELGALVVTWGVSLILAQGTLLLFGPFMPAIGIPLGAVGIGAYSFSVYWLVLIGLCIVLLAGLGWLYRGTRFGLQARATMQNPRMARALGIPVQRVYMATFGLGAALAGLSGALLAPTTSIAPFMGQQFVAPAFITVVVGGAASVIGGVVGSSGLLAVVETPVSVMLGTFWGSMALLLTALLVIRVLPGGVSSLGRRLRPARVR
jgi:branched-subunit amino acid ABC-type transport system permease component